MFCCVTMLGDSLLVFLNSLVRETLLQVKTPVIVLTLLMHPRFLHLSPFFKESRSDWNITGKLLKGKLCWNNNSENVEKWSLINCLIVLCWCTRLLLLHSTGDFINVTSRRQLYSRDIQFLVCLLISSCSPFSFTYDSRK